MNYIPSDTTIDALQKQFEILERIGIEGRAEMTFQLSDKARQELIADIKNQHPEFTEQQLKKEIIRRCYGEKLAEEVATAKGWK
jgi:hypothetical protein